MVGLQCASDASALKQALLGADLAGLVKGNRLIGCGLDGAGCLGAHQSPTGFQREGKPVAMLRSNSNGSGGVSGGGVLLVSESWMVECCRVKALAPDNVHQISLEGFLGELQEMSMD